MIMKKNVLLIDLIFIVLLTMACNQTVKENQTDEQDTLSKYSAIKTKVDEFAEFELSTDLSVLSEKEKQMLPILIDVAKIMDEIFWMQAFGDKNKLFSKITDEATEQYAMINYGPWERLNNNESFIEGFGKKSLGANFYPADITKQEFEAWQSDTKESLYTLIRRNDDGSLTSIPYHEAYKEKIAVAANLIKQAAELAEDEGLEKYLTLRAKALLTDDYFESDMVWMDMKTNTIDFVVGPIENYEDRLFEKKAAYESFILIKDKNWSKKLEKYAALLPELQKRLPVKDEYKAEVPGSSSDLGVYDALYYAGDCNAGSKTIAINLPNDERVHLQKGSRKLQLKNAMKAKFDKILVPIGDIVIAPEQRKHIKSEAFFENTMFHEAGHGIGIKNTITGKGTVRDALKDHYSAIEEGKADILGLFIVTQLYEMGEFPDKDLMDNYVTFMASIFRSVRFGISSSHGKANMIRFNYFMENDAFTRDEATGTYSVDFDKMAKAMISLSEEILVMQGDGDYEAAAKMVEQKAIIPAILQEDLDRISEAGIPRDIIFKQGKEILGL